jgi:hypothetical protein
MCGGTACELVIEIGDALHGSSPGVGLLSLRDLACLRRAPLPMRRVASAEVALP